MSHNAPSLSLQFNIKQEHDNNQLHNDSNLQHVPSLYGIPLKYISLVTLAVQNSTLSIIMHYSRVSAPMTHSYSASTAVLLNELLKCSISLAIAFYRIELPPPYQPVSQAQHGRDMSQRFIKLGRDVFSPDCWKLSIPAILYVIQNNLQYVAASNLDVATFQIAFQLKILTTAIFSVMLLRKKLTLTQWLALLCLALGVGIVQVGSHTISSGSVTMNAMQAAKGFMAVTAACFTSGLAGVYFEMVLKNTQADLWVRNVQLSLFSLIPALLPILFTSATSANGTYPTGLAWFRSIFHDFGLWAWATVAVQVLGGLITALVIKYSDNILKGFATSLSIVISFLASVYLFHFQMTFTFILGSSIVLIATWLYNIQSKSVKRTPALKVSLSWSGHNAEKGLGSVLLTSPKSPGVLYPDIPVRSASTSHISSTKSPIVAQTTPEIAGPFPLLERRSTPSVPSIN